MGFTSASCAIGFLDHTMRSEPLSLLDGFLRFAEKDLSIQTTRSEPAAGYGPTKW